MADAEFFVYDMPGMWVPLDVTHLMVPPSVIALPGGVFGGRCLLKEVQLSERLRTICRGAFRCCISLVHISFSSTVAMIGDDAFSGCSSLEEVVLTDGIRTIGQCAFSGCVLKGIVLPATLTEIGRGAFGRCRRLGMVKFSGGIQLIRGGAFAGCDLLNHVMVARKSCIVQMTGGGCIVSFAANGTIAPNSELDRALISSECFHSMPAAELSRFENAVTNIVGMQLEWGEKRERLRGLLAVHERRCKEVVAGLLELGLRKADMQSPLMCKADIIGKSVMAFL